MQYQLYHRNFKKRRWETLVNANFACQRCGVRNRSIAFNSKGEIFIVYLHAAHVFKEQKMKEDAYLICLCPRCHWFFDHPRGDTPEGQADWYFIGTVARQFIEQESRETGKQEEAGEYSGTRSSEESASLIFSGKRR